MLIFSVPFSGWRITLKKVTKTRDFILFSGSYQEQFAGKSFLIFVWALDV